MICDALTEMFVQKGCVFLRTNVPLCDHSFWVQTSLLTATMKYCKHNAQIGSNWQGFILKSCYLLALSTLKMHANCNC